MDDLRDILTTWAIAGMIVAATAILPAVKEVHESAGRYDPSIRAQMFRDQVPSEMWGPMDDTIERRSAITVGGDHSQLSEVAARRSRLIQSVLSLNINCGPILAPGG